MLKKGRKMEKQPSQEHWILAAEKGTIHERTKIDLINSLSKSYGERKIDDNGLKLLKTILLRERKHGKITTAQELLLNEIEANELKSECEAKDVKIPTVLDIKAGDIFKYKYDKESKSFLVYVPQKSLGAEVVRKMSVSDRDFNAWFNEARN